MKGYIKEIIIALIQLFMYYVYPEFTGETDAIGMVFVIIIATLLLSFILGLVSNKWIKFLYPFVVAVAFIPSIFIYYNESASIHSVWYFVISTLGLTVGTIIRKLTQIIKNTRK